MERWAWAYLQCLVPASRGKDTSLWWVNPFHALYGCIMLCHLARLACGNIKHATRVVCASRKHFCSILNGHSKHMHIQHRNYALEGGIQGVVNEKRDKPCSSIRWAQGPGGHTSLFLAFDHLLLLRIFLPRTTKNHINQYHPKWQPRVKMDIIIPRCNSEVIRLRGPSNRRDRVGGGVGNFDVFVCSGSSIACTGCIRGGTAKERHSEQTSEQETVLTRIEGTQRIYVDTWRTRTASIISITCTSHPWDEGTSETLQYVKI